MGLLRKHVPDEGAATTVKEFDNVRGLRFCEVFLIGGNAITKNLKAAVYNTTGLNYGEDPLNSCPMNSCSHLDLDAYKKDYNVLAVYLNKPRFWVYDHLKVPVGPVREFNGLKGYWMGLGLIPKDADVEETRLAHLQEITDRAKDRDHLPEGYTGVRTRRSRRQALGHEGIPRQLRPDL